MAIFQLGTACGCCASGGSVTCSPCNLPKNNLTLHWVNAFFGNGSATLVYTAPGSWSTGCVTPTGIGFTLACSGGAIVMTATYYLSGVCPSGQAQSCPGAGGTLPIASYTCSPLSLVYNVDGSNCPVLYGNGYTSFTITNP